MGRLQLVSIPARAFFAPNMDIGAQDSESVFSHALASPVLRKHPANFYSWSQKAVVQVVESVFRMAKVRSKKGIKIGMRTGIQIVRAPDFLFQFLKETSPFVLPCHTKGLIAFLRIHTSKVVRINRQTFQLGFCQNERI